MKRDREVDKSELEMEDETRPPKLVHTTETNILKDLEKGLVEQDGDTLNQQLIETQKQYFTMYMEKLMSEIPMGKAIVESINKSGHENDFMYIYTASKTIVQSLMSVKKHKALKSILDMVAGIACRYMHCQVVTPMLRPMIEEEHLKNALQAYQANVKQEENDSEIELRCLLHTIHQILEENQHSIQLVNPFQAQMTQQMKAISVYVVTLLTSISKPVLETSMLADPTFTTRVE